MKNTRKTLMAVLVAALLAAGAHTVAFADDATSETSGTEALIVSEAESGTEATTAETTGATEATTHTAGDLNVNQSPNTGVGVAPATAALLAAASIPLMLKTRKK